MKKSILIFTAVLTAFSLTAFGYLNWGNTLPAQSEMVDNKTEISDKSFLSNIIKGRLPDLIYKVDSRFMHTISKENLRHAKSIIDILPTKATQSIVSYHSTIVSVLDSTMEERNHMEIGNGEVLNDAQSKLLQTADYGTNIYIRSDYKERNEYTGKLEDHYLIYYITVLPEKVAEYANGYDALISYLKGNSREETAIIDRDKLQPCKLNFTVTKNGTVANVKLASTSGYTSVDNALLELMTTLPGKWNPATNSEGENIDQELVFFFGLEGC